MDPTKNLILPSLMCLTIAFVYYIRFYNKKPDKTKDKSPSSINNEKKEEENKLRSKNKNNDKNNLNKGIDRTNNNNKYIEEKKEEKKNNVLTYEILFDKFCDYVQKNKLVSIKSISQKLNKTKDETIKFLRELEREGKTVGFMGEDGEYFYLTTKEIDLLNNILFNSKNKKINEDELEKQFKQIINEGKESLL